MPRETPPWASVHCLGGPRCQTQVISGSRSHLNRRLVLSRRNAAIGQVLRAPAYDRCSDISKSADAKSTKTRALPFVVGLLKDRDIIGRQSQKQVIERS